MRTITVKPILTDEQVKKLEGEFIDESYIKQLINTDTRVLNEKGEPLLVFKKNCIPSNHCKLAYPVFITELRKKVADEATEETIIVLNLSGRGDKDLAHVISILGDDL